MTALRLAVDSDNPDSASLDSVAQLVIGARQRGYRWGLDTLPLFPGCWPLPLDTYDRRPELTPTEATVLSAFVAHRFDQEAGLRSLAGRSNASPAAESLDRLVTPYRLKDVPTPSGQTPRQIEIAKAPVLDKDSA